MFSYRKQIITNLHSLKANSFCLVEYVWICPSSKEINSKSKTYSREINFLKEVEQWACKGSMVKQALLESEEIILVPVRLYDDPFRGDKNKLVLCETFTGDGKPTATNFRYHAKKLLETGKNEDPYFGYIQEFLFMEGIGKDLKWPLGWPMGQFPKPQGQYYCGVGTECNFGRQIIEEYIKASLHAGINLISTTAEAMPGQWSCNIGVSQGLVSADNLMMSRYLLQRIGEKHGIEISYETKELDGDWNGSGCHIIFSTSSSRGQFGVKTIEEHMKKLEASHDKIIKFFGDRNDKRLIGTNGTSIISKFTFGTMGTSLSCIIPRETEKAGKGYYVDRRPGATIDPYLVMACIFSSTCLDGQGITEIESQFDTFVKNNYKEF